MKIQDVFVQTIPLSEVWPEPDLSVIRDGRVRPPTFPIRVLGQFWKGWARQHAEAKSAPIDDVVGPLLTTAAACLGNARWVQCWPGWIEPPVLWIQVIGKPSTGKSPAADAVFAPLRQIESEMAAGFPEIRAQYLTRFQEAKEKRRIWDDEVKTAVQGGFAPPQIPADAIEPDKPLRPRVRVNDTTPEMLGQLLAALPRGLMFQRDELAGWIGSFDRYGGSGAERALWLEAWGGREFVIDRVKNDGEPIRIPNLSVSVFGGLQPDRLASTLLCDDDDGLQARFLSMWPNPVPICRPGSVSGDDRAFAALRRLHGLEMNKIDNDTAKPGIVPMCDEAADLFHEWRVEHVKEDGSGMYGSHLGKLPGYVARLALVLEHLWWSADGDVPPTVISKQAVAAAGHLVEDYFKLMARRAYGDAALPEGEKLAAALGRWIGKTRCTEFNARTIYREAGLPGLNSADKMGLATAELEAANWVRPIPSRMGEKAGRQRADFEVNPAVLGAADV